MKKKLLGLTLSSVMLTSCATYNPETNTYSDPMHGFNQAMFSFNYNVLDPYILRPVAVAWRDYVPTPVRSGISGVSSNLGEPASAINSLFQGNVHNFGVHLSRFILNTVFGLGGLIDVAGRADPQLQKGDRQTFGTVLGHYDVPYGPYVVLPFYGSATLREDGGAMVDYLYPPLEWLDVKMNLARWVFDGIEARALALDYEELLNNSDDPYNFMRNAYFQRHDFVASGGKVDESRQQQREQILADELDDIDAE
ncbi:MlaA family lipoprotein [Orbaceae bacterium ac157xtp]